MFSIFNFIIFLAKSGLIVRRAWEKVTDWSKYTDLYKYIMELCDKAIHLDPHSFVPHMNK